MPSLAVAQQWKNTERKASTQSVTGLHPDSLQADIASTSLSSVFPYASAKMLLDQDLACVQQSWAALGGRAPVMMPFGCLFL